MVRVVWAETALKDLESIAEYIELDNPERAKRLLIRAFEKTDQLANCPESGLKPRVMKGTPYRRITTKPVLIYYRVESDTALIVHVVKEERKFDLSRIVRNEK